MENLLQLIQFQQKKEKKKNHGEIKGSIEGSFKIGNVYKNTSLGVFGKLTNKARLVLFSDEMEILDRNEVKKGKS